MGWCWAITWFLNKLGQGGMGTVYKAHHRRMDRVVALKLLPRSAKRSPDLVKRFQQEVRAAASSLTQTLLRRMMPTRNVAPTTCYGVCRR